MDDQSLDLAAYLDRIGLAAPTSSGLRLLEEIHLHHLARIPFENIDVRLGRGVKLDLDALQDKLVRRRRGGYCFEHNTLSAAALRALGFEVSTLEARVRPPGATHILPRTHMVLAVEVDGESWLYDVGFGGDGPLRPVPMDGSASVQADAEYRIGSEPDGTLVLRRRGALDWTDLYAVSPTPALPIDFEVANHYTATHPASIFRKALTVQSSTADERRILRNDLFVVRRGGHETQTEIARQELGSLLLDAFELALPPTDLEALAGAPADT